MLSAHVRLRISIGHESVKKSMICDECGMETVGSTICFSCGSHDSDTNTGLVRMRPQPPGSRRASKASLITAALALVSLAAVTFWLVRIA